MKTKTLYILFGILLLCTGTYTSAQQVGYHADGTAHITPHPSAAVEIRSNKKGILLPRLTYAQKHILKVDAAAAGLLAYQTDSIAGLYVYDGRTWRYLNPSFRLSDSGQQLRFAPVALSGDYNDLTNKPQIPTSNGDGEAVDFAKVAYSGDYNDLINKPTIPAALQGLQPIVLSGDFNDLTTKPFIPTALRDLETDEFYRLASDREKQKWDSMSARRIPMALRDLKQDSLHRTITETQRERWNQHAGTNIPTALADYRTDDYNDIITLSERRNWDEAAKRKIPTRLADLQSDEYAQTVTDKDIALWDSAANRKIPTSLRDLAQDSLHRTVTETQRERWNIHADITIPTTVADYTTDDYYMPITLAERRDWNQHAETEIPTALADLEQGFGGMLVSDEDILRWDRSAAMGHFSGSYNDLRNKPTIPTALRDLKTDPGHQTLTETEIEKYSTYADQPVKLSIADYANSVHNANGYYALVSENDKMAWNEAADNLIDTLSPAATENDFTCLTNRPEYAEVVYSGRYADLQEKPAFKLDFIESNKLSALTNVPTNWPRVWLTCSLNDIPGRPDFHTLAKQGSCTWNNVQNRPRTLADLTEDHLSVKIPAAQKDRYNDIYDFYKGTGQYTEYNSPNAVIGSWEENSLRLQNNARFPGNPRFQSAFTIPADTARSNITRVPSVKHLKQMDEAYVQTAPLEAYPEGTVLIADHYLDDAMQQAGWCLFKEMENRFPVAVNAGLSADVEGATDQGLSSYPQGVIGGAAEVALTIDQMPKHRHKTFYGEKKAKSIGSGKVSIWTPAVNQDSHNTHYDTHYSNTYLEPTGSNRPHENRPPYRAVYFIIKSKAYCGY